jgi:hypothetical protein
MTEEEIIRLDKLRWESERKQKQSQLNEKLKQFLANDKYEFLSFEESDKIQLASDDWPDNKWEDFLYFQADIQEKTVIHEIVKKYTDTNKSDSVFIFFMNFNFGLVKISNSTLNNYWSDFIEIDRDEIFCLQQDDPSFICIDKTEDILVGDKSESRQWLYEVTFSNTDIKSKLI